MDMDSYAGRVKMFLCGDLEIGHVMAKEAMLRMGEKKEDFVKNAVEQAENNQSDLVPGKYEGRYFYNVWFVQLNLHSYLIFAICNQYKLPF